MSKRGMRDIRGVSKAEGASGDQKSERAA